jgi:hypothetical protein
MLDIIHNTSFYLAVLSLLTSLVTLLTLGHVTTIIQRLRNGNADGKDLAIPNVTAEEILKRELNLELGESGGTSMKMFSYVNLSLFGIGMSEFRQQKGILSEFGHFSNRAVFGFRS